MIIFVVMFFHFKVVSPSLIPSLFGMFLYREGASIVTKMLFSGFLSKSLIFHKKSVEPLTYDLSS